MIMTRSVVVVCSTRVHIVSIIEIGRDSLQQERKATTVGRVCSATDCAERFSLCPIYGPELSCLSVRPIIRPSSRTITSGSTARRVRVSLSIIG